MLGQLWFGSVVVYMVARVWHRHGAIAAVVGATAYAVIVTFNWLTRREGLGPSRSRAINCVAVGPLTFVLVASLAAWSTLACVEIAAAVQFGYCCYTAGEFSGRRARLKTFEHIVAGRPTSDRSASRQTRAQ